LGEDNIADVNSSENLGGSECDTPLHIAIAREDLYIVRFLLDYGANIEARDSLGRTPILKAMLGEEGHNFD
jgi:ankyrin repeat protein